MAGNKASGDLDEQSLLKKLEEQNRFVSIEGRGICSTKKPQPYAFKTGVRDRGSNARAREGASECV